MRAFLKPIIMAVPPQAASKDANPRIRMQPSSRAVTEVPRANP
jgi:hypothetical protein